MYICVQYPYFHLIAKQIQMSINLLSSINNNYVISCTSSTVLNVLKYPKKKLIHHYFKYWQ